MTAHRTRAPRHKIQHNVVGVDFGANTRGPEPPPRGTFQTDILMVTDNCAGDFLLCLWCQSENITVVPAPPRSYDSAALYILCADCPGGSIRFTPSKGRTELMMTPFSEPQKEPA